MRLSTSLRGGFRWRCDCRGGCSAEQRLSESAWGHFCVGHGDVQCSRRGWCPFCTVHKHRGEPLLKRDAVKPHVGDITPFRVFYLVPRSKNCRRRSVSRVSRPLWRWTWTASSAVHVIKGSNAEIPGVVAASSIANVRLVGGRRNRGRPPLRWRRVGSRRTRSGNLRTGRRWIVSTLEHPPEPGGRTAAPLGRWDRRRADAPTLVCIGDSITSADAGAPNLTANVVSWVDLLAAALSPDQEVNAGFRGMWRRSEWSFAGTWTRVTRVDPFDLAPFEISFLSSGATDDRVTWTKPAAVTCARFELLWFAAPGAGRWQYRVDGGQWTNLSSNPAAVGPGLQRFPVDRPVRTAVEVRGHDGSSPCIAPIAGILVRSAPAGEPRPTVHCVAQNGAPLRRFCRPSTGDPLALLDLLGGDVATVMFSNDVTVADPQPSEFENALRKLLHRLLPTTDVVVLAPFEQAPPRFVTDAVTEVGSKVLRSVGASFTSADLWARVSGPHLLDVTRVSEVVGPDTIILSRPATGSDRAGALKVGGAPRDLDRQVEYRETAGAVARELGCAFIDLDAVWTHLAGPGWSAAHANGLMIDALHPSARGHEEIARQVARVLGVPYPARTTSAQAK